MSTITVVGAGIGRQFINGDPNWCEWRVSYEIDGRGLYYHSAETRMTRRTPSNGPSANSVNRISAKGAGPKPRVNGVRNGSAAQESTLCFRQPSAGAGSVMQDGLGNPAGALL